MYQFLRSAVFAPLIAMSLAVPAEANPVGVGSCTVNGTLTTCIYTGNPNNHKLSLTVTSSSSLTQTWRADLSCAPGGPAGLTLQISRTTPGMTTNNSPFFRSALSACVLRIQQLAGSSLSTGSATAD